MTVRIWLFGDSDRVTRARIAIIPATLLLVMGVAAERDLSASSWRWSSASAYSTSDSPGTQGCTGRPLRDDTRTFASLIVPCGARVQFCAGARCVTARRTDSGPYVAGRSFDLALGTVRALGFGSAREFGVRTLRWRRNGRKLDHLFASSFPGGMACAAGRCRRAPGSAPGHLRTGCRSRRARTSLASRFAGFVVVTRGCSPWFSGSGATA